MNKKRNEQSGEFCSLYSTSLGIGAVVAGDAGLVEIFLPFAGDSVEVMLTRIKKLYPAAIQGNALTDKAARLMQLYFAGEKVDFKLEIDTAQFTPFQELVYQAVAAIPHGEVRTYAEVAAEIGRRGAARGIGTAMARNPLPVVIPCHRVVGASGTLTGYSAPGGIVSKKILLVMEGITVDEKGLVKSVSVQKQY